jgi:16S rRNA (guanine527-N7)-methyltransferase
MEEILREGFTRLGLALPPDTERRFLLYSRLLTERNRVHNLTAITDEADIARLHFLDCAAVLPFIPNREAEVVDVGAGAGFPGLVLKLLEPRLRMTLLDSQRSVWTFSGRPALSSGLRMWRVSTPGRRRRRRCGGVSISPCPGPSPG